MSIKFKEFIKYLFESLGLFFRNILPIIFVTSLTLTFVVICSALLGYSSLLILSSESVSAGLSINFSSYTIMILVGLFSFIALCMILALYSAMISIYAFYISFKSEDENYRLFFSLIKEHLWKIIKVSLIVWIRVFIGTIFFIIPGIVLAMRYAAINYFVILENANFTTAKVKSAEVMNGFKITFLLFYSAIYTLSAFVHISKDGLVNGDMTSILYLILSFLFQGVFFILYSVIIYTICKNEAYKNVVIADAPQTPPTTEVISSDPVVTHTEQVHTEVTPEALVISPIVEEIPPTPVEAAPAETKEVEAPTKDKPESPPQN